MDAENDQDAKISKCVRFFKTLMRLSEKQTQDDLKKQTPDNPIRSPTKFEIVRQLVRELIYGDLLPENFTIRLQETLKSQAQSNLLPFISSTLPGLKLALRTGSQKIEEIGSFEEYETEQQRNNFSQKQTNPAPNNIQAQQSSSNVPPTQQPFDSMAALDASIDGVISSAVASVSSQPPIQNIPYSSSTNINYYMAQNQTQSQSSNMSDSTSHLPITSTPSTISSTPIPVELVSLPMEMSNVPLGIMAPPLGSLPVETFQVQQQLDASTLSGSLVNRHNILSDDHLNYNCILNFQALAAKIHDAIPESEVVDYDVLIMISNAVESKLRRLITNLAVVAEHRLEPLRILPNYKPLDDPRKQLRFMENIERHSFERHENLEREAILKFSKSKGKDKDAMERAKQMQKADKEAAINRDANAAAIAALGTSKSVKRAAPGGMSGFNSTISHQTHRPRIKRVTMQDLKFVMCQDQQLAKSELLYKIALSNSE